MKLRSLVCSCLLLFVAHGCGGERINDLPKLGAVKGVVTLNGKPLSSALITFIPQTQHGRPSTAVSDSDGSYELVYTAADKGAVVGKHRVTVTTRVDAEYADGKIVPGTGIPESVPRRYNAETSIEVDVQPGSNTIDLPLTK